MKGKTVEGPKKGLIGRAHMIIMISDDEDDVVAVKIEEIVDTMDTSVKEDRAQSEITGVKQAEAVNSGNQGCGLNNSDTLLCFIRRYCVENVDTASAFSTDTHVSAILSPNHPKDIIQACSHTPYCLYLFMGVELGGGQSTSVVLVGYLDQSLGVSVVRLLHTLQMSVDIIAPQTSADMDTETLPVNQHTADSDAHLLIDLLKNTGLALSNLAVFYCNAPHPGGSQVFVSQLQAFSPMLVSLCGLPGMAERACQSGVLASFNCVADLVRDIHHHYSTCHSVNDSLKEIFADAEPYSRSQPISEQCLFIMRTVQKVVSSWSGLVDYFKSLSQAEDVDRIRTQLMDYKVKLQFLFLSQALEPLRALQELQQYGKADVAVELQLTSMLIHSYAASILRPSVTERFLRRRDPHLLHNEKDLLPTAEVNVGSSARDFMWSFTGMNLREQERSDFLKAAVTFYKASLESLVQSIPEQLGDLALRNINILLKHPENSYVRSFISILCK